MGLNDIFFEVERLVTETNNVINALTDPNRQYIDQNLSAALFNYTEMGKWHTSSYNNLDKFTGETIKYLLISYGQLVEEYDDHIMRIREGVDVAFTQFYNDITNHLKSGIALVYNEIIDTETALEGKIDSTAQEVRNDVQIRIDDLDTKLTDASDTIKEELETEDLGLWARILESANEVMAWVTLNLTALKNTVEGWVGELSRSIGSIVAWVEEKFSGFYTQITDWVGNTLSSMGERITTVKDTLMGLIDKVYSRAESLVNTAKAWLVSEIGRLGNTLRGLIDAAINQVQDLLDDLALLTDWRFAFFNLSLSFPELGFLQVLNRDDETFKRFKPYWQALFARVMEEE